MALDGRLGSAELDPLDILGCLTETKVAVLLALILPLVLLVEFTLVLMLVLTGLRSSDQLFMGGLELFAGFTGFG